MRTETRRMMTLTHTQSRFRAIVLRRISPSVWWTVTLFLSTQSVIRAFLVLSTCSPKTHFQNRAFCPVLSQASTLFDRFVSWTITCFKKRSFRRTHSPLLICLPTHKPYEDFIQRFTGHISRTGTKASTSHSNLPPLLRHTHQGERCANHTNTQASAHSSPLSPARLDVLCVCVLFSRCQRSILRPFLTTHSRCSCMVIRDPPPRSDCFVP